MRLKTAAEKIRAEVAAGDYIAAVGLLEDFREAAEEAWRSAASPEERERVAGEVTELLEWARSAVMAARAHQKGKLLQFRRSDAYQGGGARKRDHLELDA